MPFFCMPVFLGQFQLIDLDDSQTAYERLNPNPACAEGILHF